MMQGARIGEHTFIDSLDVMDLDLVEIEDEVVIGEGTTVLGHSFEGGKLHFCKVLLAPTSTCSPQIRITLPSIRFRLSVRAPDGLTSKLSGTVGEDRQRLPAAALLHCSGRLEAAVRLHTGPDGKHA